MKSGKLKYTITLQELTVKKDNEGIEKETWIDISGMSNVRSAIDPLRGKEYFQAAAVGAENTIRFTIRYREGVTTKMRIKYGSHIFNIRSVIDVNEQHIELQLLGDEYVDGN